MNAAQKQQESLATQLRKCLQKGLALLHRISSGIRNPVVDHPFIRAIQTEALTCEPFLFFGREQHGARIAQYPIFRPWPVHELLQMLEGVFAAEPGVEHAVSEYEVRGLR